MTDFIDNTKRTMPDDQLDAALAKYAAVEPRAGLEERILANLKAQERPATGIAWWRWAGALAAALLIAILLVWRMEKHIPQQVMRHPITSQPQAQPQVAGKSTPPKRDQQVTPVAVRKPRRHVSPAPVLAAAEPKLDQFPSPQPLTNEEKMLLDYVGRYYDEAVVIARVQGEQLERNRRDEESGKQ